jgi:hypothetical protein
MEKYILTKRFQTGFSVSGSTPVYFIREKGQSAEGVVVTSPSTGTKFLRVPFVVQGANRNVDIPFHLLRKPIIGISSKEKKSSVEGSDESNENTSVFTLKNIVIGLVVVAVAYGVLKATKVIK